MSNEASREDEHMTMMPSLDEVRMAKPVKSLPGLSVESRSWGYSVTSQDGVSIYVLMAQLCSGIAGFAGILVAIGIWAMPGILASAGIQGMQLGASIIILAVSFYFLWFASRGLDVAVEVDLNQGEVREAVQNRIGGRTILSRYGFDAIADVVVVPGDRPGQGRVMLVSATKTAFLSLATGPRNEAASIAARLRNDLLLGQQDPDGDARPDFDAPLRAVA